MLVKTHRRVTALVLQFRLLRCIFTGSLRRLLRCIGGGFVFRPADYKTERKLLGKREKDVRSDEK